MPFEVLAQSVARLKAALHISTQKQLVAEVSLRLPADGRSEGSFIKSVLWSYALWFEACQPAGRHLLNIVRNSSSEDYKSASRTFLDIQNLRTFHAHNLLVSNKSDQHKLSQAKAWLALNGASEGNWERCTDKLCSDLAVAFDILYSHWTRVTASPEDAATAVSGLTSALEREWEPYLFDAMVEDAAASLGLPDFDSVKYRKIRLDDWRKITELFLNRASADAAIRRAIYQEMVIKFGPAST